MHRALSQLQQQAVAAGNAAALAHCDSLLASAISPDKGSVGRPPRPPNVSHFSLTADSTGSPAAAAALGARLEGEEGGEDDHSDTISLMSLSLPDGAEDAAHAVGPLGAGMAAGGPLGGLPPGAALNAAELLVRAARAGRPAACCSCLPLAGAHSCQALIAAAASSVTGRAPRGRRRGGPAGRRLCQEAGAV